MNNCPKCKKSDEVVTRPDGTKYCLDCGERIASCPSDATACSPRYCNGEGPECPYCGCCHTADESHYFDEGGFEIECNDCEREFKVWPNISVSWRTESVANAKAHPPADEKTTNNY